MRISDWSSDVCSSDLFGLQKVAKYYYVPAFHEPGPGLEISVNKAKFEALPADLQAIVRYAAAANAQDTTTDYTYHNIQAFKPLHADYDVELRSLPDDIVARPGALNQQEQEENGQTDALTKKTNDTH